MILKLILRSWCRNKLFMMVSIISLTVGLACTNLLTAFVLHEYNVEGENENRERIFQLTQRLPGNTGKDMQTSFVYNVQGLQDFPEIEQMLHMSKKLHFAKASTDEFIEAEMVKSDSLFMHFFPVEVVSGQLEDALKRPDCVAVSEEFAKKCFGTTNCVGKVLQMENNETLNVVAVFNLKKQSCMKIDLLSNGELKGSVGAFIMLKEGTDKEAFRKKYEATELPTLLGKGHYELYTLQEAYFDKHVNNGLLERRDMTLLTVAAVAALLVLFIGCFNYVNLNFSRMLRQVKMLRIEGIMGAKPQQLRQQLFLDTFLLLMIAFLLSLLMCNDLLKIFNHLIHSNLSIGYLFSAQVLPLLLLMVGILSVIPATYVSYKVQGLTESSYRSFYTGRRRQLIVGGLVTLQFIISMALVSTYFVLQGQLGMIREIGDYTKNVYEFSGERELQPPLSSWWEEVKQIPGVVAAAPSMSGLSCSSIGDALDENQPDMLTWIEWHIECMEFPKVYQLEIADMDRAMQLIKTEEVGILINETYKKLIVPEGEDPVGQPIYKYLNDGSSIKSTVNEQWKVAGILKDFNKGSMNHPVLPLIMTVSTQPTVSQYTLAVRLDGKNNEQAIRRIQRLWEEKYPGKMLQTKDMHEFFLSMNIRTYNMADIITVYSGISLALTLFGLFGITRYAIEQRRREIAIRKVHGAHKRQILWMLNRPFMGYIGIAFIISTPITYYLIMKWLEGFHEHISPNMMHFVSALLIVTFITFVMIGLNSYHTVKEKVIESMKIE